MHGFPDNTTTCSFPASAVVPARVQRDDGLTHAVGMHTYLPDELTQGDRFVAARVCVLRMSETSTHVNTPRAAFFF